MEYPVARCRRLRKTENMRRLVRGVHVSPDMFVAPVFVCEGKHIRREIPSMPGVFQFSCDTVNGEIEEIRKRDIPAVLLFGIPGEKDPSGSGAYSEQGIVQKALRTIKKEFPDVVAVTDVCLCEYTSHGHCGLLDVHNAVDNDATLPLLARTAVSHVRAGADMVAPSSMMDGQVLSLRRGLDEAGFTDTPVMAYSAKYASSFYGPFRDAAESAPGFGDRRAYQMDTGGTWEALKEIELDLQEGADIIMVKPALCYLDIIREAKDTFCAPLAAYNVSGEYSMVKSAVQKGWLDEKRAVKEMFFALKRAGTDILITYFAKDAADWIRKGEW